MDMNEHGHASFKLKAVQNPSGAMELDLPCCRGGGGLGRDFLLPVLKVGLLSCPANRITKAAVFEAAPEWHMKSLVPTAFPIQLTAGPIPQILS